MDKADILEAALSFVPESIRRKEAPRTAFIAALIMDRAPFELAPHIAAKFAAALVHFAEGLHGLAEKDCNVGLSERDEARREKLATSFTGIAGALGFKAETTGDPRGAVARLINPDKPSEGDGFGEGWAVYL